MKYKHIINAIAREETLNHGQKYSPFMTITDLAEAQEYFSMLVEYHMAQVPEATPAEAERIERANLIYFSGYSDASTRSRVTTLVNNLRPSTALRNRLVGVRELLEIAVSSPNALTMKARTEEAFRLLGQIIDGLEE